jgi:hypothetical protein
MRWPADLIPVNSSEMAEANITPGGAAEAARRTEAAEDDPAPGVDSAGRRFQPY